MPEIVKVYPAYTIVRMEEDHEYSDGEDFAVAYESRNHGTLYHFYCFGSVETYAEKNGMNGKEAIKRAMENGHELYYAYALGVMLTSTKQPHRTYPLLSIGQTFKFRGKTFMLTPAPNNNVRLLEI